MIASAFPRLMRYCLNSNYTLEGYLVKVYIWKSVTENMSMQTFIVFKKSPLFVLSSKISPVLKDHFYFVPRLTS
jgi:hypothetical protein